MRKSLIKVLLVAWVISLIGASPATAAGIKVLPSKPVITVNSPSGSGDQISDISVNSSVIAIVGTVEAGLTDLVTSPTLGASDGFIAGVDKNKKLIWNLRLGGSSDDIATAITRDKVGNFWIVGATSKPSESSTVSLDTSAINLDSVSVDAVITPKNSLTRLVLWKVSPIGELSQTYFYDFDGVVSPSTISSSGTSLRISGNLSKEMTNTQFTISSDMTGTFSGLKVGKIVTPKPLAIETIKAGTNKITSFISKTTIIDIPSWRAKKPTPVIVKYSKASKALAANSLPGKVKKVLWQSGIGAVVLVEVNLDNQIHILTNMA